MAHLKVAHPINKLPVTLALSMLSLLQVSPELSHPNSSLYKTLFEILGDRLWEMEKFISFNELPILLNMSPHKLTTYPHNFVHMILVLSKLDRYHVRVTPNNHVSPLYAPPSISLGIPPQTRHPDSISQWYFFYRTLIYVSPTLSIDVFLSTFKEKLIIQLLICYILGFNYRLLAQYNSSIIIDELYWNIKLPTCYFFTKIVSCFYCAFPLQNYD